VIIIIDVKKRSNKNFKNVKNVKKRDKNKETFVNVIKNVTSTPRLMPKNGLRGDSEYAIQFSFAETVVVLG